MLGFEARLGSPGLSYFYMLPAWHCSAPYVTAQVNLNSHPDPHEESYYASYMARHFGFPFGDDEQDGGDNRRPPHPSLQLPQAAALLGPLDVFSHLTGLEQLRELQVCLLVLSNALLRHDGTTVVLHKLCSAVQSCV